MNTVSINIEALPANGVTACTPRELQHIKATAVQICRTLLANSRLGVRIDECTESGMMFVIEGCQSEVIRLIQYLIHKVNISYYGEISTVPEIQETL